MLAHLRVIGQEVARRQHESVDSGTPCLWTHTRRPGGRRPLGNRTSGPDGGTALRVSADLVRIERSSFLANPSERQAEGAVWARDTDGVLELTDVVFDANPIALDASGQEIIACDLQVTRQADTAFVLGDSTIDCTGCDFGTGADDNALDLELDGVPQPDLPLDFSF